MSASIKHVIKRDGRKEEFNEEKIVNAINKAFLAVFSKSDAVKAGELKNNVMNKLKGTDNLNVEDIQDIVETVLIEERMADVAKSFIIYRHEHRKQRDERKKVLNKTKVDKIDESFDMNSLRVLASRYLLKDENGEISETPRQLFERIAILIGVSDILHDESIFKKFNGIISIPVEWLKEAREYENKIDKFNNVFHIGEYYLNQYHFEAFVKLYLELAKQGSMKISIKDLLTKIVKGEFDKYEKNITEYFILMVNKDFLPNTPTIMNAGAKLGQLSACFVLPMEDGMKEIMKTSSDAAMIFKSGGGVGINYSDLRPEGDMVFSTSGVASGAVSFMSIINTITDVVKQGGKRRGANMAVMEAWHPEIEKFIAMKQKPGVMENFNVSMGVWEDFWQALVKGSQFPLINKRTGKIVKHLDARQLIDIIAESAWKSAEPGIIFFDNINKNNPLKKVRGYPVRATNPCFHPDTLIETVNGAIKISEIREPVRVYTCDKNGKLTTSMASASWKTRENAKTLKIVMNNGKSLIVTPDHKIMRSDSKWIKAKDLQVNDSLVALCRARRGACYSGLKLSSEDNRAYRMEHRFVYEQMHGNINDGYDIHHINGNTYDNSIFNLSLIKHKEHSRLTMFTHKNNHQVQDVDTGRFVTHINSKRGLKTIIEMPSVIKSAYPGIPKIVSIEQSDNVDVYDIAVEDTHNVIANGIVAHNCGEQSLYPYESCNLGSINLANFIYDDGRTEGFDWERFERVVRITTRFLDNVIDVNKYPIPEIEQESKATRRIGLGIMGIADLLFKLQIQYNSEEGYELMERIAECLTLTSMLESVEISKERGAFGYFRESGYVDGVMPVDGYYESAANRNGHLNWVTLLSVIKEYGIRNSYNTTIAPTGTLSMIADCSSGVEPIFALTFEKKVTVGNFIYANKIFEEALRKRGLYNDALLKKIANNHGSVQGIEEIPEDMRKVFVTAMDLHWADHVYAQAVWQRWINNAIAKTINMAGDSTKEDVKTSYLLAHELGLKGITVYRDGSRATQVLHLSGAEKNFTVTPSKYVVDYVYKHIKEHYVLDHIQAEFTDHLKVQQEIHAKPAVQEEVILIQGSVGYLEARKIDEETCPSCSEKLIVNEGCDVCINCGFSSCSAG